MTERTYIESDIFTVKRCDKATGKIVVDIKRKTSREIKGFEVEISPDEFSPAQQKSVFDHISEGSQIFRGNGYFYYLTVYELLKVHT